MFILLVNLNWHKNYEKHNITGGTRGLGLEYARHLSERGYNVGLMI